MRRLIIPAVFAAVLIALASAVSLSPGLALAQPAQIGPADSHPPQTIENNVCLGCHQYPNLEMQLPSGEKLSVYVDAGTFEGSVHGQQGVKCVACHSKISGYPHPPLAATTRREAALELYTACRQCHADNYDKTLDSIHQQSLEAGNPQAAICTDCHGAHHDTSRPEQQPRTAIAATCAKCHSTIYDEYKNSVHGAALSANNPDVPTCVDCHGVHNIPDPTTTQFRLNSPTEMCGKCHTDKTIMDKYGISTQVLNTYVADFHGATVTLFEKQSPDQQTNKPVCFDCHGIHNISAVDDPNKGLQVKENILEACQKCHPDASTNFPASWLSHYIPSPTNTPLLYGVNLFYTLFIPAVLGGMGVLVILDAYRQIANRTQRPPKPKKPRASTGEKA